MTTLATGSLWNMGDGTWIRLLTPDDLTKLPNATEVTCINGRRYTIGIDKIDGDTRGGNLAYGLPDEESK